MTREQRAEVQINSKWAPEVVKLLTVLWLRGDTALQVATELNRVFAFSHPLTRNAVISKVSRLGLPLRATVVRTVSKKSMGQRIRAESEKAKPKLPPQPVARSPKRPPSPEQGRMTYAEHRDFRDCAMFCEGEEGVNGRVCGKPCAIGMTFCPSCVALAYQPAPARKQGRAA